MLNLIQEAVREILEHGALHLPLGLHTRGFGFERIGTRRRGAA